MTRFEREKERKVAAHRRALLRKESEISEWGRRIRELEIRLSEEAGRLQAICVESSNLQRIRANRIHSCPYDCEGNHAWCSPRPGGVRSTKNLQGLVYKGSSEQEDDTWCKILLLKILSYDFGSVWFGNAVKNGGSNSTSSKEDTSKVINFSI